MYIFIRQHVISLCAAFNFVTNAHDVVQLPKASYDSCNKDSAIGDPITKGPAKVTLSTAGDLYFICSVGTHCQGGQKLAINVSASGPAGASPTAGGPTAQSLRARLRPLFWLLSCSPCCPSPSASSFPCDDFEAWTKRDASIL